MGSYRPATAQPVSALGGHAQAQLTVAVGTRPDYLRTEQLSPDLGYCFGSSNFKQPVPCDFFKLPLLNRPAVSGTRYFSLTKFLCIGFSSTDVIFPFHQFW